MNKATRKLVYDKFNGKCAYTGRDLDITWQVDHAIPVVRKMKYVGGYYSPETGLRNPRRAVQDGYRNPENHCIENMLPALRIINHYKRDQTVEQFRKYISGLQGRINKMPKNTSVLATIKRKEYLLKVADAFGISISEPFSGKFYFEETI